MSYFSSGASRPDYLSRTRSRIGPRHGIYPAAFVHLPGCPTPTTLLDRCSHCLPAARISRVATTSDGFARTPSLQWDHAPTLPSDSCLQHDAQLRPSSGAQQSPSTLDFAQRRMSADYQQQMEHAQRQQGRSSASSPVYTNTIPIPSRRSAQHVVFTTIPGLPIQGVGNNSNVNSYSPNPYGTRASAAMQAPQRVLPSCSVSSRSPLTRPTQASTSYGAGQVHETPPSPYYSPRGRLTPSGIEQTRHTAKAVSQPNILHNVGEHMPLGPSMDFDASPLTSNDTTPNYYDAHESDTGLVDDWSNMPDSFFQLDDVELDIDVDALAGIPLASWESSLVQQPYLQSRDPRSVPQMIYGTARGSHRHPQAGTPDPVGGLHAASLAVPASPSVTSSTRQRGRPRRTGAQLRDPSLPHQCSTCSNTFSTEGDLQRHARIHVQDRPHHCDICGKGFNFPKDVRRHMLVHYPTSPVDCPVCGTALRGGRWDNFLRHMKDRHAGHPIPEIETVIAQQAFSSAMAHAQGRTM